MSNKHIPRLSQLLALRYGLSAARAAIRLGLSALILSRLGCGDWFFDCWKTFIQGEKKHGPHQSCQQSLSCDASTQTNCPLQSSETKKDESSLYPTSGPPKSFLSGSRDRPQPVSPPGPQRERFMPKTVPCRIATNLNDIVTWHKDVFEIDWLDNTAFVQCQELLNTSVQRQAQATGDEYFIRSVQYRIMEHRYRMEPTTWKNERTYSRRTLSISPDRYEAEWHAGSIENSGEWKKKIPNAITEAFKSERDSTFIMELELLCSSFKPFPLKSCQGSKCGCANEIQKFLVDQRRFVKDSKQRWFIPRTLLTAYLTTEVVMHLIENDQALMNDSRWQTNVKTEENAKQKFVSNVYDFLVSLLATCLFIELDLRCLYHLYLHDLHDDTRLLEERQLTDQPYLTKLKIERLLKYQGYMSPHRFKDPWSLRMSLDSKHYLQNIDPHIVVPVVRERFLGKGTSGTVYRVSIPERHHRMSENVNERFAMKSIKRGQSQTADSENESDILRKLTEDYHPHLLPLLASWTQAEKSYLLLPLADSNLHEFMRNTTPCSDGSFIVWLITQMAGLASAVNHLHHRGPARLGPVRKGAGSEEPVEFTGMHGDLKPANILVFSRDILKVGDFGHSRLKQKINGESYNANAARGDPDYCSPDHSQKKKVSRPHDVWALGCIFLEMLIWAFFGAEEVERFSNQRLRPNSFSGDPDSEVQTTHDASFWYDSDKHKKPRLKDVVIVNLDRLEFKFRREYVFEDILKAVKAMLKFDPKERMELSLVSSLLDKMKPQAELLIEKEGSDYFAKMLWSKDPLPDLPPKSLHVYGLPSTYGGDQASKSSHGYRNEQGYVRKLLLQPSSPSLALPDANTDLPATGGQFETNQQVPGADVHEYIPATPTSPAVIFTGCDTGMPATLTYASGIFPQEIPSPIETIIEASVAMHAALGTTKERST